VVCDLLPCQCCMCPSCQHPCRFSKGGCFCPDRTQVINQVSLALLRSYQQAKDSNQFSSKLR
jgi:hypothetical protein